MNAQEWAKKKGRGAAAILSKLTGIGQPAMCKKLHFKQPFTLTDALILDRVTAGEIRAEEVCPAFAEDIAHLRGVTA